MNERPDSVAGRTTRSAANAAVRLTRRHFLLAPLAVLTARRSAASVDTLFPPPQLARIREGLHAIYSLEHPGAAAIFERMIAEAPDDPAGYVYLAMTIWLRELHAKQELSIDRFAASDFFAESARQLVKVEPAIEVRFREVSQSAIARARARLNRTPGDMLAQYLLGLAYQNLASFEASLKRNWWAAFRSGSRTYDLDCDLLRRDPQFYDVLLATGVYNYVAGSLGWSVRWLALLMGYRGSRQRGKQELETAARQAVLAADDARVILVLIETRERDYPRAYGYLAELLRRYPKNYLVHLDMAGLSLLTKQPAQAIELYQDILRKREAKEPNYQELDRASLYNRLGVAVRGQGDLAGSAEWFGKAIADSAPASRAGAVAHLELGKTLDLMGRRPEAVAEYRKAAAAPDFAGSQAEAQERLRKPYGR
jgi:tetratricopeptide (TPR) repeat protein